MQERGSVECAEEAAFVELLRTTEVLSRPVTALLKESGLSPAQYNMLRILRGAPEGLTCGAIGDRMISRDPDITRLLDRLEKRNLVFRARDQKDRRVVLTRISSDGLALLESLEQPITQTHRRLLGHLGPERLQLLTELLGACRRDTE